MMKAIDTLFAILSYFILLQESAGKQLYYSKKFMMVMEWLKYKIILIIFNSKQWHNSV